MPYLTGGQVVVDSLAANGVDVVFGIPGTHSLPIYRHLGPSGIRHITPRHEQGAGYAADGYARSSGRPGVCLVTTGPGVTNIATALGQAYSDSIPLLVVSPGLPFDVEGGDHGYLHETKCQIGVTANIVAWSRRVGSQQELADTLQQAFAFFRKGRPRPVHVEVPLEVLDGVGHVDGISAATGAPAPPRPDDIAAAAAALEKAGRATLVLGGGARQAAGPATRLAEARRMAVVTTMNGKGVVSEHHPLSLGATFAASAVRSHIESSDVVLAVGTELGDSDLWGHALRPRGTFVRLDVDPAQLNKNVPADVAVQGDAELTLQALAARFPAAGGDEAGGATAEELAQVRRAIEAELGPELAPYRELHKSLEQVLSDDAIVAGDATMACYYGTGLLLPLAGPSQWLYPTGFCTLGYGLPAAIGAKIAFPGRQVVGILGDGGIMFTLSELATAATLGLGLPIVVVTNGGYGEIRRELQALGASPVGTDFPVPDFVAVARGLRAEGVRTTPTQVGAAVEEAFGRDRPTLIEVEVNI